MLPGQDMEGRTLQTPFGRPGHTMEMFEFQGTAAAQLASEDYAMHQRVSLL